jgi:hypothetical protein
MEDGGDRMANAIFNLLSSILIMLHLGGLCDPFDYAQDRLCGKRNLVVVLGREDERDERMSIEVFRERD